MIPFKTTNEQVLQLSAIVVEMLKTDLDRDFVAEACRLATVDQGVYDLMALWQEYRSDNESQDTIIADIQDCLDDRADAPTEPLKKPYIKFDQLDGVASQVVAGKAKLRQLIEKHGGVSEVARKSGIPQPSLSRLLNSASMPRRSTLYKIANALGLSEADIAVDLTR